MVKLIAATGFRCPPPNAPYKPLGTPLLRSRAEGAQPEGGVVRRVPCRMHKYFGWSQDCEVCSVVWVKDPSG